MYIHAHTAPRTVARCIRRRPITIAPFRSPRSRWCLLLRAVPLASILPWQSRKLDLRVLSRPTGRQEGSRTSHPALIAIVSFDPATVTSSGSCVTSTYPECSPQSNQRLCIWHLSAGGMAWYHYLQSTLRIHTYYKPRHLSTQLLTTCSVLYCTWYRFGSSH
ncbi:hypothetical protein F5Y10DRAFT_108568 [Nemania abortiva]|nr:hypothetical protein F5Y10DRAFT_108568 [Nemania abortiva]